MLQDPLTIRTYQRLTDALVELWERGYRSVDELRLFLDGYLSALRATNALEAHKIHRLEEEAVRFIYDSSNFTVPYEPELQTELDR